MTKLALPQESDAQEIGDRAVEALTFQKPRGWKTDVVGHDFGIDLQVQAVNNGNFQFPFRAQVKGSTVAKLDQEKNSFAVLLKVSTANHLNRADSVRLTARRHLYCLTTGRPCASGLRTPNR
jgi:hypothetical protein